MECFSLIGSDITFATTRDTAAWSRIHTSQFTCTRTLTSGPLISISSRDILNSPERDVVLLEEARKMTYLMHVNVIYTLGLTIIMNATFPKFRFRQLNQGPATSFIFASKRPRAKVHAAGEYERRAHTHRQKLPT